MTEENKKTSEFLYEDEYVFLTEDEELFLKDGGAGSPEKLCEVSKDEVEDRVAELKQVFSELEAKVQEKLGNDKIDEDTLTALEEEVRNTAAIGARDLLLERIEGKRSKLDESQSTEPEEGSVEVQVTEDETAAAEVSEEETVVEEDAVSDEIEAEESEEAAETGEVVESDEKEEAEVAETESEDEEEADDGSEDDPVAYYKDIVKKAEDLAKQSDWPYVSMELDNLSHQWSDGPDTDSDKVKKLFQKFNKAVEHFQQRKKDHYEELNKQKKENLETKKNLLEEFEGIISNETWTASRRVSQMKRQWNSIGPLPSGEGDKLDKRFDELLEIFNDHKVDRLVQQRQKEEDNLMLKLAVLEKMENVAQSIDHTTEDWKEIDEKFDDLTKQWKKIGRVPKEKSNNVWDRYKSAQDEYYDRKYKYDPDHQSKVDKFSHKKEKIIEEAEALLEADDIASAARKINKLHRRWKKVGNLPQRLEDDLWGKFKAATDAFNERKSENQDKIHEQEEKHYEQKLELIDEANAIKDTDDFDKGHSKMQSLMDRWKKIGPVPRKKSNKIWKRFKGAMDEFYDRRREHFKEVKEERKDNLKEKQEILDKLHELGQHDDPIEAVEIAKGLQEKFKNAGYVPIKHKNKMWKEYREACDVIYDRFRAAKSGDKFDQELAKADLDPEDRNKIQKLRKEFKKVKKEVRELEQEVLQYKEKKTYFKPSGGGNSLLDEVENKIDKAEQRLEAKQQKMDSLTDKMEDIRAASDD
ncbi:MAG TPA: DUF349 domain-containing protein [Balneolaceae bacterium]|nr:DUF349 domain-containing protein [Balneolaceae bacterium]